MPRLRFAFILPFLPGITSAAEPLRTVIDRELKAGWDREKIKPAPRSTDSEFLRRVFLDLCGTVPNLAETTAFLADTDPNKREKLVDKLLADPRFATAQMQRWDIAFFGRVPMNYEAVQKRPAFQTWLAKQFADNVPYDKWVQELMLAETPGTELFWVQYRGQPEEMAVAVSRQFLGTQLQCARCHDHPFEKWTQKDFFGLAGFFVRLVVQESGSGVTRMFTVGEKGSGDVLFAGNAKEQKPGRRGDPVKPRFLGSKTDLDEPPVPKDFKEPKSEGKLPKPAFSRKAKFAEWIASKDNPYLAKAAANRIWAQFMGRGLIHPIDDIRTDSVASHPALFQALTDGLVEHNFDLKWLMREIANSESYQLAMHGPSKEAMPKWFEQARVRPLSMEELVASLRVVTNFDRPGEKPPELGWEYFRIYFGDPVNGLGDFQGSLSEHLFWNNSEHIRRFIQRKKGNLLDDLATSKDSVEKKVEKLFLAIHHRPPTPTEAKLVTEHLSKKDKTETLLEEAIWVLVNSSEFRFNH